MPFLIRDAKSKSIGLYSIYEVAYSCEGFPLFFNQLLDKAVVDELQMLVSITVCDVPQSTVPVCQQQQPFLFQQRLRCAGVGYKKPSCC